jgi:uncharacterized repeat protein (TIGR04138 family)
VHDLELADQVLAKIREHDGQYHARAYVFVLEALEYAQTRLPSRRHISGGELAWGCRDLAREHFGLMARTVLEHWGIIRTEDFGRVVFTLVEIGLLAKEPGDRLQDFEQVYDFESAFDGGYRWTGMGGQR